MRRLALLLSLFVFVPVAPAEEAVDGAATAPDLPKIATFDLVKVYDANEPLQSGLRAIDAKFHADRAELERLQTEARRLRDQLRDSPLSRSSPEFRQLAMRAQRTEFELQQKTVRVAAKVQAAQAKVLKPFFVDLQRAVEELAKENGYDLVLQVQRPDLDRSPKEVIRQINQTVLFHASPRFDITKALIARIASYHE